jgi:hypothetical protein
MQILVEAPSDRDALPRVVAHVMRRPLWKVRICGLLVMAVGALQFLPDPPNRWLGIEFLVIGLFFAAVLPSIRIRQATKLVSAFAERSYTHRLDDWGIESVSDLYTSRTAWQLVDRVEEIPGHLVLRVKGNRFAFVPSAGLSREEIGEIAAAVARANSGQETMAG